MAITTPRRPARVRALTAAAGVLACWWAVSAPIASVAADAWIRPAGEPQHVEQQVTLHAIAGAVTRAVGRGGHPAGRGGHGLDLRERHRPRRSQRDRQQRPPGQRDCLPPCGPGDVREDPGCGLPWTLLAAIGRVESDHGRYGGSVLGFDARPQPAIVGIALNGQGPVRAIGDTDDGRWDGDPVWDRAVGPMQFIPGTWATSGRDGDGDGLADPHDLDDAALAAAAYLCRQVTCATDRRARRRSCPTTTPRPTSPSWTPTRPGYRTGVFDVPTPFGP